MINCPGCSQSLPDWAQKCQFCGSDTTKVVRPVAAPRVRTMSGPQPWVWGAYYAISGFYVLNGLQDFLVSFSRDKSPLSLGFHAIFDGVTVLLGIGLLLKLDFIRGVINFFCGVQILLGILSLIGTLILAPLMGLMAVVSTILTLLQIFAAAFMIYLIGETDLRAPNI